MNIQEQYKKNMAEIDATLQTIEDEANAIEEEANAILEIEPEQPFVPYQCRCGHWVTSPYDVYCPFL